MSLLTDLLAYWQLDETSGTRFDAHASYDAAETGTVGSLTGIINNGADFPKSNSSYLEVASGFLGAVGSANTFSLSFWVKPDTYTSFPALIDSATRQLSLFLDSATSAYLLIGNNPAYFTHTGNISTGAWHHVVVTWNGGTNAYEMWVDGVSVKTGTVGSSIGTEALVFGANPSSGGSAWDGGLDEFGVWTRVLTITEVGDLYNSGAGLAYSAFGGGSPVTITLGALSATGTPVAPVVAVATPITLSAVSATGSPVAPVAAVSGGVSLSAIAGTGSPVAPTLAVANTVTPAAVAATGTPIAPAVAVGTTLAPAALSATGTPVAPAIAVVSGLSLPAVSATGTPVAPVVSWGSAVTLPAVVSSGSPVAPAVAVAVPVTLTPLTGSGSPVSPAVALVTGATLSPLAGSATLVSPVVAWANAVTLTPLLASGSAVSPTAATGWATTVPVLTATGQIVAVVAQVGNVVTAVTPGGVFRRRDTARWFRTRRGR